MTTENNLWENQAKRWKFIGSPLRPSQADVARVESCFARLDESQKPFTGIILGVTPELANANLDMNLTAIDSEQAMIDLVWPGDNDKRKAIVGNWLTLSQYVQSVDWVMGDGSLNALEFSDYDKMFSSISSVLKKDGYVSLRVFQRPQITENVQDVLKNINSYGNFHIFKWHLVMALQGSDVKTGVKLADVWDTFNKAYPNINNIIYGTKWSKDEIDTINNYKDVQSSYSFPLIAEVADVAKKYNIKLLESNYQKYELSERCPHLFFQKQ
jgi:hypothetical protein